MLKSYATEASLMSAIRRKGMYLMHYVTNQLDMRGHEGKWTAIFIVDNEDDYHEVRARGFLAELEQE